MERSKRALSLYEDKIQGALYSRVPSLTDQQHAKVAQLISELLIDATSEPQEIVLAPPISEMMVTLSGALS